jgi:para-nitrobenzyl esterase
MISPLQAIVGGQPGESSEDCLYLNVFAPARGGGPFPVMVWIHGGAFVGGSGSARWYDGGRFAADGDVVVVTLNYRLGALGFLDLSEVAGERFPSSGNLGLLDQIAALRWVQENIAVFGGDPRVVTVFGESAGAMSIGVMLAMPAARGLFHRAILQSGAGAEAYRTRPEALRVTEQVLAAFGGSVDDLVGAPVGRILEAQVAVTGGSDANSYLAFRPVVDGVDLPEAPDRAVARGRAWATGADLAVLVGTNKDEMTLFQAFDAGVAQLTDDQVERRATASVGAPRWARMAEGYRRADPGAGATARWVAFATDLVFRIPAIRLAEALAGRHGVSVWMYRFDCPSPASEGRLGATHALEIPFVWDLLDHFGVVLFTGDGPQRRQLAAAVHAAWLAFATTGTPTTALLPEWPRYEPGRRATMLLDETCRVVEDPGGELRRLWEP